ncbi:hypothetical protein BPOR_0100g00010 [Botrytis porri]|uniref:Uncharacterized protein n=1 Tax=Botrytis porri TaxID=87229 RepID=A0A4Z1KYF7_9HELO|nr:hypothetical protein BPOR_0100g00010 [Botrytis porri]
MSGKGSSGSSSSSNSLGSPYTINSSGTNSQGNSYDNRSTPSVRRFSHPTDQAPNSPPNHNRTLTRATDGSYYYANGNGSTYYYGSSGSTYTAPSGTSYKK